MLKRVQHHGPCIAPTVEGDRIRLRAFHVYDADAHWRMLSDPSVMTFLHDDPLSREDAWRRLVTAPGLWVLFGYGYWAVERKADGSFIGQVGFGQFRRDMRPSLEGLPEMGWMLAAEAQGQGFAGEAVAAALRWADGALPGTQIVAIIEAGNAASIRVAERAGFTGRERSVHKGDDVMIFRR